MRRVRERRGSRVRIDELLDAIGEIDPVYIEEAEKTRFVRRRRAKYWVPASACAALLILGGSFGLWRLDNGAADTAESAGAASDMAESAGETSDMAESAGNAADAGDMPEEAGEAADMAQNAADAADAAASGEEAAAAEGTAPRNDEETVTGAAPEYAEDLEPETAETIWKVNEVDELQTAVACGAAPASVEYYTAEELEDYYGIRILPETLPGDYALEDAAEKKYTVGYGSDGSVIEDNCMLLFYDTHGGELRISARTVDMGEMTSFADTKLAPSVIGGTKITVGHYRTGNGGGESGGYLAVYEKDGVTVTVEGIAMKEADFKNVLESLLK